MPASLDGAIETLYSVTTVQLLEQDALVEGGPVPYLTYLRRRYLGLPINKELLASAATYVEPIDPVLGTEIHAPTASAFHDGTLLGLRASELILGTEFFDNLLHAPLPFPGTTAVKDPEAFHHLAAVTILHFAEKGHSVAPMYDKLLENWEDELVPNVRYQRFLRDGFGFMMFVAGRAVQVAESDALAEELSRHPELDWDQLLRD